MHPGKEVTIGQAVLGTVLFVSYIKDISLVIYMYTGKLVCVLNRWGFNKHHFPRNNAVCVAVPLQDAELYGCSFDDHWLFVWTWYRTNLDGQRAVCWE